jgi:hypothetical protein
MRKQHSEMRVPAKNGRAITSEKASAKAIVAVKAATGAGASSGEANGVRAAEATSVANALITSNVVAAAAASNTAKTCRECDISKQTLLHFRVERIRGGWAFPTFDDNGCPAQFRLIRSDTFLSQPVWARREGLDRPAGYNLQEVRQNLRGLMSFVHIDQVKQGQRDQSTLTPDEERQMMNPPLDASLARRFKTRIWVVGCEQAVWCMRQNGYVAVSPLLEGKGSDKQQAFEVLVKALQKILYETEFLSSSTYFGRSQERDVRGKAVVERELPLIGIRFAAHVNAVSGEGAFPYADVRILERACQKRGIDFLCLWDKKIGPSGIEQI